jgi:molybdopterin biosynthesis enzyme
MDEAENVRVHAAVGRVLAQDVGARMSLPPHAKSAVDGYAVDDRREPRLDLLERLGDRHQRAVMSKTIVA